MESICTINVNGRLLSLDGPVVMGILNVTPDSFYSGSRVAGDAIVGRAREMMAAGAAIIDIGACSTRPGAGFVSQDEELRRLHSALELLDKELPGAVVSVDTFRGKVALECVREHNVAIVNDVSGFEWDRAMFGAVAALRVPYVLTHSATEPGGLVEYDEFVPDVIRHLAKKIWQLRQEGVADIIVDPGFGFGKSLEQNYELFAAMENFSLLEAPLLVGVSRKSMVTRLLGVGAGDALPGTVALNMAALERGARILRVHDVPEAVQVIDIWKAIKGKRNI
jgi:dihydropteroate synthase